MTLKENIPIILVISLSTLYTQSYYFNESKKVDTIQILHHPPPEKEHLISDNLSPCRQAKLDVKEDYSSNVWSIFGCAAWAIPFPLINEIEWDAFVISSVAVSGLLIASQKLKIKKTFHFDPSVSKGFQQTYRQCYEKEIKKKRIIALSISTGTYLGFILWLSLQSIPLPS